MSCPRGGLIFLLWFVGDVEDCTVSRVQQTSFTPLADAVCWVILQLSGAGQNAVLDSIHAGLASTFPEIEQPSRHLLYDTLADLMSENKVKYKFYVPKKIQVKEP